MRNLIGLLMLSLCWENVFSQVGIYTTSPKAQLDIHSSNQATPNNTDGILIPKIDVFPAINPTIAQQSMLVYLTTASGTNLPGFYYWDNISTNWIGISSTTNGDKDWYKVGTTTAPNNITDDMFHNGKVGVGNSNPFSKFHVTNNSSGMIPNVESVATLENDTNAFLNILSNAESGVVFGANGISTNGGIIYNPPGLPNGMMFRTNGNINRMVLSDTGNLAIGNFVPSYPLNFSSSIGDKISLWGTAVNHYGFGIQANLLQIHSANIASDIAFGFGNSVAFTEIVRIKGIGYVGIGETNPTYPLNFPTTNGDKISLWGTGASHYGFGIQANLLQIHSANNTSDIAFGHGSSFAFTETMRIKGNGDVGIGTTPNARLQITASNPATPFNTDGIIIPKIDAFPITNPTALQNGMMVFLTISVGTSSSGFYYWDNPSISWVGVGNKSNWSLKGNKGTNVATNFIGTTDAIDLSIKTNNIEAVRITSSGNIGIGVANPAAELEVNGFTKMGSSAPAIKTLKFTGNTGAVQGNQTAINHGLTSSKILSINVLVEYNNTGACVPPSYNGSVGYEYDYFLTSTQVIVWTKAANSANILSKPIRILVTYEQ